MISKLSLIIISIFISFNVMAVDLNSHFPKSRTIQIKPITETIINIVQGRAVKFIFPWILSEDDGELPFLVTLSNDVVFNEPIFEDGQNVLTITFAKIDEKLNGVVTDLLISTHGYHFSFTLKVNDRLDKHYSTVVLKLSKKDKLELINRELEKLQNTISAEKIRLEKDIDRRAKIEALKLVGALSKSDPNTTSIKEETILKLNNGDKLIAYIDDVEDFGVFNNFNIELENDGNEYLYIKDIRLAKVDKHGNKNILPSSYLFEPKLEPNNTSKGTLSTLNFIMQNQGGNVIIFSTNKGDVEVKF